MVFVVVLIKIYIMLSQLQLYNWVEYRQKQHNTLEKEAVEAVAFGFAEDRKYTAVVVKLRQTPICSIIL